MFPSVPRAGAIFDSGSDKIDLTREAVSHQSERGLCEHDAGLLGSGLLDRLVEFVEEQRVRLLQVRLRGGVWKGE